MQEFVFGPRFKINSQTTAIAAPIPGVKDGYIFQITFEFEHTDPITLWAVDFPGEPRKALPTERRARQHISAMKRRNK